MIQSSITFRAFLVSLIMFGSLGVGAQNDRTFPNVSAQFTMAWPCIDATNGPWTAWEVLSYSTQPSVQHMGLDWGEIGPSVGRIAVEGERVFFWSTSGLYIPLDSIIVLYDFGLVVGDTAYYDEYYFFDHAVVDLVETIQVEGRERHRLEMNNGDVWIEGIGSLMGVLRPLWEVPLGCGDPVYTFCAEYMDELDEPYTWCSEIILGKPDLARAELTFGPNPSTGPFFVRGGEAGAAYRISDALGRTFLSGTLIGFEDRFDLSAIPKGLYLLHLERATSKLVLE